MIIRRFTIACSLVVVAALAAIASGVNAPAADSHPALPAFEFQLSGAKTPEAAAESMFRAVALRSPKHFVQHLLLGVCDGPVAPLQKFAEAQHVTQFTHGDESFTVYDLPKAIDPKEQMRVLASAKFDSQDKKVAALELEAASTYYGKTFRSVDVAGKSYDGREYRTRIVVAEVNGLWYAMPRCRSARSFYAIADAMELKTPMAEEAKKTPVHPKRLLMLCSVTFARLFVC